MENRINTGNKLKKENTNKGKSYHFRDNDNLLENISEGSKSEFIRESLRLRINIDDTAYQQEQATINELKTFYTTEIQCYDEMAEMMKEELKRIYSLKRQMKQKLTEIAYKERSINNVITTKKELIKNSNNERVRKNVAETLIRNSLHRREDPTAETLNIKYLLNHGGFTNKTELRLYIQEYIEENLKSNEVYINWILREEDINYIKLNVNKILK